MDQIQPPHATPFACFDISTGLSHSFRIEDIGFTGGIWLCCPRASSRKLCWNYLRSTTAAITDHWILIRDFNAILYSDDLNCCAPSSAPEITFQDMVFDCSLKDLGFHAPRYTWFRGYCSVCLDRGLGNFAWFETFPLSSVENLIRMKSNHRPLLLSLNATPKSNYCAPFRYLSVWPMHPDFERLVKNSWDHSFL
ncbi:uncharacterized protein LOC120114508 [Hibiscus syriacus]|uniref:uncharacterized protein LOC120114508 n=1 Tax=Hibiscus syriacus TaxID=106335 RepID=UPI001923977F|nr:uncharacterized protein LOC120114508 [Hibiscus syriacus]